MTKVFHASPYPPKFIETKSNFRKKVFNRTNHRSNFLGGSFSNHNNLRAPIQFTNERQSQNPRDDFTSRKDVSIFKLLAPESIDWSNEAN